MKHYFLCSKGYLNIKMMYFHRYIRLTPVVAVVILYIMSLYKYSGAGPMWMKLGTQDKRCEDTWWATLLYVQNYAFPYKIVSFFFFFKIIKVINCF